MEITETPSRHFSNLMSIIYGNALNMLITFKVFVYDITTSQFLTIVVPYLVNFLFLTMSSMESTSISVCLLVCIMENQ
jgi:hypothetical protein